MYLVKGDKRYNKEFDTISNYDKEKYEYEDWWENGGEEKAYKRDEMKFASDRLKEAEERSKTSSNSTSYFKDVYKTLDYFNKKSKNK